MSAPSPTDRIAGASILLMGAASRDQSPLLREVLTRLADECSAYLRTPSPEAARELLDNARGLSEAATEAGNAAAVAAVAGLIEALEPLAAPPRAVATAEAAAAEADEAAGSAPLVLVIEDDRDTRLLLRHRLTAAGYRVVAAEDGGEGIGLAQRERPALIISDLQMPLAPGELVILSLRTAPETAGIPILVLSGDPSRLGPEHQIDAVLPKPFDAQVLLTVVRDLIRQSPDDH
jgi:CheY-like chemotaxis protein